MTTLHFLTQSAMLGSTDDALLASAAKTGIAELGGYLPATLAGAGTSCPAESKPQMPDKAAGLLKRMLAGELDASLSEFLQLTAERGYIVPPETLPALLGLGKNELRKLVIPVIGERGRWLAAHNPAWAYALGRAPLEAWENGLRAERVAALEQVRVSEPGKAREWVQASWEQDSPEDRAAFLATFSVGLGMDDEPFLETCLDDKRKEVREKAQYLLVNLPDSRLVARMLARIEPLLQIKSKLLGGETLTVTLPEGMDTAMKRDGLTGHTWRSDMGPKSTLLAELLSFVPPIWWVKKWNRPPAKLLAAALSCEEKQSLLLGWQAAARRCRDIDWIVALAESTVKQAETRKVLGQNAWGAEARHLPLEKLEALAQASISPVINELNDHHPLLDLLEMYQNPWSEKLARMVLASVRRVAGGHQWRLVRALPGFAMHVPPPLAGEFSQGWPEDANNTWRAKIDEFLMILRIRNEMMSSLK